MLTLELGRLEFGLLLGAMCLACIGLGLVAWFFWRQHKQLQRSLAQVCGQVAVFAEASVSVAQTVEQSLVLAPQAGTHGSSVKGASAKGSSGRREVLQVAARRLAQQQSPLAVQQALGLKDDELKLLCLAAGNGQSTLQASEAARPSAPRAVA